MPMSVAKVRALGKRTVLSAISVLLIPVAILDVAVFIVKNWQFTRYEIVLVFWHWSFGHTISGLDYAARLFHPHKAALLFVPHTRSNPYLPLCFERQFQLFSFATSGFQVLLPGVLQHRYASMRYHLTRSAALIISSIKPRLNILNPHELVYRTLSINVSGVLTVSEDQRSLVNYKQYDGYARLLKSDIGCCPKLPSQTVIKCRAAIRQMHPTFFQKPFVVLSLRGNGIDSRVFSDSSRTCGPSRNYIPAIQWLSRSGFHIVGNAEADHEVFRQIEGYFNLNEVNLPPGLLSIFLLTECSFFIGNQSGPYLLPSSVGIPCLIADNFPYTVGTFRQQDLLVPKRLYSEKLGRVLSLREVFSESANFAFGLNFDDEQISLLPSSAEDILDGVVELVTGMTAQSPKR